MAILTTPVFYFISAITTDNNKIDFKEPLVSGDEITGTLNVGSYSMSELVTEVSRVLNLVGSNTYTVTLDRTTRFVTIAADSDFSLLISSGSNLGFGVYSLIGFSGSDQTSITTTTGIAIGTEYVPQFPLDKFRGFEDNLESVSASINESASGRLELITFGTRSFMEFNIKFITDETLSKDGPIISNPAGVQDSRDFLTFCITKGNLEFMKSRDLRSTFNVVVLESTASSKQGVGFELREHYELNLIGYYQTGTLKYRKVS